MSEPNSVDTSKEQELRKPAFKNGDWVTDVFAKTLICMSFVVLVQGVFLVAFLLMLMQANNQKPLVFGVGPDGALWDVRADYHQVDKELVFQFLDYAIPRIVHMEGGQFPGHKMIDALVDEKVLKDRVVDLEQHRDFFDENNYVITAAAHRLEIGSGVSRTFVINEDLKVCIASISGIIIINSDVNNQRENYRWDIEMTMVPVTDKNRWGLRITQFFEMSPEDPPMAIPDYFFGE